MVMAEKAPVADSVILEALKSSGIKFELYTHPPFDTCEASAAWHQESGKKGVRVKNLFLRNKNGKKHFVLMLPHGLEYDKAAFKTLSGEKCGFASNERLWEHLKTIPGSVSPLALVHDKENQVALFIEGSLLEAELLHVHPGNSQFSVALGPDDLIDVAAKWNHPAQVIDWTAASSND